MSSLAERFRELDRADAYARSLGREHPDERAAWHAVARLAEQLHGDPSESAPSWSISSWDHTDPADPAVWVVTHDSAKVVVESGSDDPAVEAAASGRPVVATAHSGLRESVVDGVTGYLVPERDVDALGERIARLLADRDLRRRFGTAGREHAVDSYDQADQLAKVEAVYDRVRGRRLLPRAA